MKPLVTPAEMAEADRRTIAAGTPIDELMERAGRAVAWSVRDACGGAYGRHAVIVCGKGNNGGDGRVTARVLRAWGMRVDGFELDQGVDRTGFMRALRRADVAVDNIASVRVLDKCGFVHIGTAPNGQLLLRRATQRLKASE